MAKDFFHRYFQQDGCALVGYHRELRKLMPEKGKLLDLGCGDLTELARYRTPLREVWGTDFHTHPQMEDHRWFRQTKQGDVLPFPNETLDMVASSWVLEHVRSPQPLIGEVSRVLRPGGWFVAVTPHGTHYVTWIIRMFRLLPHELTQKLAGRLYGRPAHDTFPTYYRLNTEAQIRRAARAAGLHLANIQMFATPHYFAFWEPLRRAAVISDWILDRLRPGLGRVHMVVSLCKPGGHRLDTLHSELPNSGGATQPELVASPLDRAKAA